jgi:hypothetical protein
MQAGRLDPPARRFMMVDTFKLANRLEANAQILKKKGVLSP